MILSNKAIEKVIQYFVPNKAHSHDHINIRMLEISRSPIKNLDKEFSTVD